MKRVAPLLLRKGLHLPGREALSERKTLFLSGLTLVVALVLEPSLYELPHAIHGLRGWTDITVFLCHKEIVCYRLKFKSDYSGHNSVPRNGNVPIHIVNTLLNHASCGATLALRV